MTVNTTNITGFIVLPNDTVREKSKVIFTMTGFDTDADDNAVVVTFPIEAPIAADGSIDIDLWPNPEGVRATFYRVTFSIYNGNSPHLVDGGLIEVPVSGGPYDLNDLLPIAPPQGATVAEYIAQLAASVAAAEAAAIIAQDAADASLAASYPDRATAIAASVPTSATVVVVQSPSWYSLEYSETTALDAAVALTTNGGARYWRPASIFSPQHYAENTTPGTTDMIDALDAMSEGLSGYPLIGVAYPDYTALYRGPKFGAPTEVTFFGEQVAISRPWIIGALDTDLDGTFDVGPGEMYGVRFDNGRLVATSDFDATPLATHTHPTEGLVTAVPAYLMVLGSYETTDRRNVQKRLFYVDGITLGGNFEIDCQFKSGAVYLANTHATTIEAAHIFNIGKNKMGIKTGVAAEVPTPNHIGNFNPLSGAPFAANGIQNKNTELRIGKVMVSGFNRQADEDLPVGETIETMGVIGIGIYTADFHLDA